MFDKKKILGVGITDASREEILEFIIKGLEEKEEKYFIVTANPEILVLAYDSPGYKNILNRAKIASADGIGVVLASNILGKSLKARVTGINLLESICQEVSEKPITVGFLGGGHKIAELTAECLASKYPGLKISFVGEEWPKGKFDSAGPAARSSKGAPASLASAANADALLRTPPLASPASSISKSIIHNSTDILFVAFGAPKQEMWINENLDKIPVKIAIGVGGAFDYISGKVGRAPAWTQRIGLEWLYRLVRQPWRIKRQLSLLKFIWLVLKEKLN